MPFLPKTRLILVAALAVIAASSAQAFTFESGGPTKEDAAAARFGAGDSRFSTNSGTAVTNGQPGTSSMRFGSGSLQFNSQPGFNQRYNSERMFDSNSILGRDR